MAMTPEFANITTGNRIMPQFWAGVCDNKIHVRETENGFGGWGNNYRFKAPALFTTMAEAQKHYECVCKVEIKIVSKLK